MSEVGREPVDDFLLVLSWDIVDFEPSEVWLSLICGGGGGGGIGVASGNISILELVDLAPILFWEGLLLFERADVSFLALLGSFWDCEDLVGRIDCEDAALADLRGWIDAVRSRCNFDAEDVALNGLCEFEPLSARLLPLIVDNVGADNWALIGRLLLAVDGRSKLREGDCGGKLIEVWGSILVVDVVDNFRAGLLDIETVDLFLEVFPEVYSKMLNIVTYSSFST